MTLTQLAEKHNLDPVAFRLALQEWITSQEIICGFRINDFNEYAFDMPSFSNDEQYNYWVQTCGGKGTNVPLIARPSLLEE
jgi:hypothetical protein